MRWKSVALAVSLLPACAGCGSVRNWAAEVVAANSLRPVPGEAQVVIPPAGADPARPAYSAEFRDGFFDGYVESLDRGAPAPRPALPPMRYARDGKHRTPEGQRLARDYFLGFQYGAEAAAGKESRPGVTVAPDPAGPLSMPRPASSGAPKLPKPEVPVIPPFDPPLPGGKFAPFPPLVTPPRPDLLPVPKPPLPTEPLPVPPAPPVNFFAPATSPTPTGV
jgi:hypothetical protein